MEALAEARRSLAQTAVLRAPVVGHFFDRLEALGVPRLVGRRCGPGSWFRIFARAQVARADVPREPEGDPLALSRSQCEGNENARPRCGVAFRRSLSLGARTGRDGAPRERQRVEPVAAEPGGVDLRGRVVDLRAEARLVPGLVRRA